MGKRGPVWPVMGASEDHVPTPGAPPQPQVLPGQPPGAPQQPPPPEDADKGFPDNTPLAQMTEAQRTAYFKHQNRKSDEKLQAFNGFTPQDVSAMWNRLEELEAKNLSDGDRAVREASKAAATEAKTAAESALLPRVQMAELKAAASEVIKGDQLKSFLAIANPAVFAGEGGVIDEAKVIEHLTALYGGQNGQQPPANGQQQQSFQWGQHGGRPPTTSPGDGGREEAKRRQGVKT